MRELHTGDGLPTFRKLNNQLREGEVLRVAWNTALHGRLHRRTVRTAMALERALALFESGQNVNLRFLAVVPRSRDSRS